ncbi:hypothetical protein ACIRYZ_14405 [Kitasatospora sp. NPDC101155]|uniref:hypothetical protein n=1 Tax=Kitasatospora sp. NPDC101155 TaxID=3364097 RepID=UPI0037F89CC9
MNSTREVWTALDEAIEQRGWPDRMLYALYPAAMGNRLRRATYQADAELSEQQAQRDIREIVRAGWLADRGEAQGATTSPAQTSPRTSRAGSVSLARCATPTRDPAGRR